MWLNLTISSSSTTSSFLDFPTIDRRRSLRPRFAVDLILGFIPRVVKWHIDDLR
jgi:hypothetical protein